MIETKVGSFEPERRMLIDGELVEARRASSSTTSTRPPRRCSARSPTAARTTCDRAIAAARRAFDETDWSTNQALRKRCLEQLQEALEAEQEAAPRRAGRRGRRPGHDHPRPAAGRAARGRPAAGRRSTIDEFAWERDAARRQRVRRCTAAAGVKEPVGVVGAIMPWNFPFEVTLNKLGQASPRATRWCSSRRRTRRGTPPGSAG